MALAKKHRLNLRLHRQQVESACQKIHSPLFVYLIAQRPGPETEEKEVSTSNSRFAILLSNKLAKKAVDRNKIKRKISQSIQDSLSNLPQHHDLILIPKKNIINKNISQISQDITRSLHKFCQP